MPHHYDYPAPSCVASHPLRVRLTDRALCLSYCASKARFRLRYSAPEIALYCASGRLSLRAATAIDRAASANQVPGIEPIALARLAMRHLHDALSEIATFAHRTAHGASLRDSTLQRCYRDAHSGTQHILLADEIVAECGRVLLGIIGPTAYWTLLAVRG